MGREVNYHLGIVKKINVPFVDLDEYIEEK
jgi:hypothetical protein